MNLNQITVHSPNVKQSAEFYTKLGLLMIVDSIPRYARFECPEGDSTFSLHQTEEKRKGSPVDIYFECEDLDKQAAELKSKGFEFELDPTDQSWLWREAHLRDPDGNKIILFHAGENRKNPPWRIE